GREETPFLELGVKVHLDEESHRRHRPRRLPARDQPLDGRARTAVRMSQEVRIERAHGDPLGARAADLLAPAARAPPAALPVCSPQRLREKGTAVVKRSSAPRKEARPLRGAAAAAKACAAAGARSGSATGAPAATQAPPVSR